jgi:hypothetical protein
MEPMSSDPLEEAFQRAQTAYERLRDAYPQRNDNRSAFQAALDEYNAAATALTDEWNK